MTKNAKNKFRTRTNRKGVALRGYDPVAYFTDGKPTKGSPELSYRWSDAEWWFSSAEHRDLFAADPLSYAPQFGGNCAVGAATGHRVNASPKRWRIDEGRSYLNKDRLAAALHRPLTNRIRRLAAELRSTNEPVVESSTR